MKIKTGHFPFLFACVLILLPGSITAGQDRPDYLTESNIVYCSEDGTELKLNAFLPKHVPGPVAAIVEIHGGWWHGGDMARQLENIGGHQDFVRHGLAVFSIQYRLGKSGGFPQCIRDCRNAVRFIRKNAERFNIDPNRIDVTGGSAGGHLSLMVAMVPEDFDDGGPSPGLEGVSAHVSGCFSFIPPTDFIRFWNQGPDDTITNDNGGITFRGPDPKIPYDSRPRLRVLFHGIVPDSKRNRSLYMEMCPMGQVRKNLPPLLICDGEKDPIVPGLHGKALFEKLQSVGTPAIYWMTPNGGHAFPSGKGFEKILDDFLVKTIDPGALPAAH